MDEKDEIVATKEKLLLSALPYDFLTCCRMAEDYGGVVVPAHVNKDANSVLGNLGFFPPDCAFRTVEVRPECPDDLVPEHFFQVHSSDAHYLEHMAEPEHALETQGRDCLSILKVLAG